MVAWSGACRPKLLRGEFELASPPPAPPTSFASHTIRLESGGPGCCPNKRTCWWSIREADLKAAAPRDGLVLDDADGAQFKALQGPTANSESRMGISVHLLEMCSTSC